MNDSIAILVLHSAIVAVYVVLARLFPTQKKAAAGIYLILMPVGSTLFMEPESWLVAVLALCGIFWVFRAAHEETVRARDAAGGEA